MRTAKLFSKRKAQFVCCIFSFIRSVSTGASKGIGTINYTYPFSTRVAPTLANLDNDPNIEAVLIGSNASAFQD